MFRKPNDIPGFLPASGFVDEEPKYDDKQRPFSFTSNLSENSFNWQNVYDWDPTMIKKEHDVEKMQSILNDFVKCTFNAADMRIIQNPLIFRLLQVLQIVVEYIAHSQTEIQTLYGKAVHENSVLKSSVSRYKVKNGRLVSALRNMKEVEKCPVCSSYFDSDISLDRHIHKNHSKIYDLWSHVRQNKEFSAQEEVKKLNRQIDAMRILLKKMNEKSSKPNRNQSTKEKEEENQNKEEEASENKEERESPNEEEENSKESTNQFNIFELSDTTDDDNQNSGETKKYKYIIDSDYQPFHKAVHHDDGPYLVFQEMSDYSISIEPQEQIDQRSKHGTDNKYYKKAKLYLSNSPQKSVLAHPLNNSMNVENENKNNINLDYQAIDDENKIITGKKIKTHLHDQAHEVKMSHMESGPKWKFRKKVEDELKNHVPEIVPKSTIHQMFENLNFYNSSRLKEIAEKHTSESEPIEEEEEEEEEEEIELTSACYSSIQFSSEKAEYYSQGGGGTTGRQQAVPSLYNPGGRRFPIKEEKLKSNKNEKEESLFASSSHESKKIKTEKDNKKKTSKDKKENKLEDESLSSFFSSQNSSPPVKTSVKFADQKPLLSDESNNDSTSFVEVDFKKMAKSVPTKNKDNEIESPKGKRKKVKRQKNSKQSIDEPPSLEGKEEADDGSYQNNIKEFESENSFDKTTKQPKSLPIPHRRKRHNSDKKSPIELKPSQSSSLKSSKHDKTQSSSNINVQIKIEEEEEDVDRSNDLDSISWDDKPAARFSRSTSHGNSQKQILKSQKQLSQSQNETKKMKRKKNLAHLA
ncbi:Zinc finger protein dzip1 [Tritrichomonas musculus]|uniref:Zinc finger protein dzip1 n=1 Tax=Tritrichomonas musculus TaxID=1915356 RepID=A0ABR2KT13_9EUKA